MEVFAVADDLTGALEVGAKFAGQGFRACVSLWPHICSEGEVVVVDAETRHLPAVEASERVARCAGLAQSRLFYLKTDSTLRGNIAAEIAAVAGVFADADIEYAPAYPSLGRTVVDGQLLVDGVRVHETAFSRDPLNPVLTSDVRARAGFHSRVRIHDGRTEEDVAAVAAKILRAEGMLVACGPACLAGHLAAALRPAGAIEPGWPAVERCLVVNGSAHPASRRQIASANGWVVATPGEARAAIDTYWPDTLILFGGDTSFEVLTGLGVRSLQPIGEVLPGIPLSRIDGGGPRQVITKAGGFGDVDVLSQLRKKLQPC